MSPGSFLRSHSTILPSSSLSQEHAGYKIRESRPKLTKEQLKQITSPAPEIDSDDESEVDHDEPPSCNLSKTEVNNLNFELLFAGFLRTAELTCEPKDLENRPVFEHTKLQRCDATFADNDEHAVVLLRSSKSDHDHTGAEIEVANTGEDTPLRIWQDQLGPPLSSQGLRPRRSPATAVRREGATYSQGS
ncbi:hypothetical protein V8E54_003345 [Elaphomyces granulatus]|jgi:hypothetical protein